MDIHTFIEDFRRGNDHIKKVKNVKFEYFDFERNIINHINDNRFSIIKKSRAMHITTLLANYVAYTMLTDKEAKTVIYMSNMQHISMNFIDKVREAIKNFDPNINFKIDRRNEFRLDNDSMIRGVSTNRDALRGYAADILIFDEAAFICDFGDIIGAAMTSLGTGGKAILTSTTNGYETFYKIYENSILNLDVFNKFKPLSINYKDNPRYNEVWFDEMSRSMNRDNAQIECELLGRFLIKYDTLKEIGLNDKVIYNEFDRISYQKGGNETIKYFSLDIQEGVRHFKSLTSLMVNSLERE